MSEVPPRLPESIQAIPDQTTLTGIGQTTRVRVTGFFADESTDDLTSLATGTTYRVSNPGIARIDQDGLLTGLSTGSVFVTAVNQGATSVTQVNVLPDATFTTVQGVVRREDGTPVETAHVTVSGYVTGTTDSEGRFLIAEVPANLGALTVAAQIFEAGHRRVGVAWNIVPNSEGATTVEDLVLLSREIPVPTLAAGIFYSMALKQDGGLWGWGANTVRVHELD